MVESLALLLKGPRGSGGDDRARRALPLGSEEDEETDLVEDNPTLIWPAEAARG